MTPSLADIQNEFGIALRYLSDGSKCDVISDHFTSEQRIQIYRNNFIISLVEVLKATYPMTEALVGEECFEQLARKHALLSPPTSCDISTYGVLFEETVAHFPEVINAAPYIKDAIQFEWCCDASHSQLATKQPEDLLPLSSIGEVPEAQQASITLCLKSNVILFSSKYSLFSLQQAIELNQLDNLDINNAESGFIHHLLGGSIERKVLSDDCYSLLLCIAKQQALEQIAPEQLAHLNTLIELDLIAGFSI
ncbi:DNA-binding domain-containing protein [Vibrio makurazakiensis]|uniref:HvfC/BufC N-terminal domain-containing protein n=1 Tax=Vibrio makurazakiensis TaxID=2910250 RepID=UPI003D1180FB